MPISRRVKAAGHVVRLLLFALFGIYALRLFLDVVGTRGWGPAAFFWLLVITGAISLVWRATVDLRKAVRRLRA